MNKLPDTTNIAEMIQALASGAVIRSESDGYDGPDYFLDMGSPRIRGDVIEKMIREGWLSSFNGGYRLTDEGLKSYLRSTDEMGDGKLVQPVSDGARGRDE
jgi:hypothetical protein